MAKRPLLSVDWVVVDIGKAGVWGIRINLTIDRFRQNQYRKRFVTKIQTVPVRNIQTVRSTFPSLDWKRPQDLNNRTNRFGGLGVSLRN